MKGQRTSSNRMVRTFALSNLVAVAALGGGEARAGSVILQGELCEFQIRTLHQAGAPVFLLGVGEIDPSHLGPELLAVDGDGKILQLNTPTAGDDWTVAPLPIRMEPILVMNNRPTINIADVHSGFAGNEIVIETENNVNVLVQTSPGQWQKQVVFDGSKFIGTTWGVRTGDIDPGHPGQELFYIREGVLDFSFGSFTAEVGGNWQSQMVFDAEVGMDSAIGDSNIAVPGNEIVVATEMGPVYEITPQPGNPSVWPRRTLWNDFDNAGWTLRIADILPNLPGNEIAYGSRYTDRILLSHETGDGKHEMEVLFTGSATELMTMWDIGVGDIVSTSASLEIMGVDNLGLAYLVQHDGASWSGHTIWQDTGGALHAVVIEDFLPQSPGPEIIVAGQSGAITLISRPAPADLTCDGAIDINDLFAVIAAWGPCADPSKCPADLDNDSDVDVDDLFQVLANWS